MLAYLSLLESNLCRARNVLTLRNSDGVNVEPTVARVSREADDFLLTNAAWKTTFFYQKHAASQAARYIHL